MDNVIKNLYTLFNKAWEENNNGRGTEITRMVTTFVPEAIQNLQAYEDLEAEGRLMILPCKIGDTGSNMTYRVFDKTTNEDITDKYNWVITPDGKLHYNDYGDLIGYPSAMYIICNIE